MAGRLARVLARIKSAVPQARYDAAGTGRRLRGWFAPSSGPNRAIEGLHALRNRARDAQRNEWAGASGARVWTTNLVGTGIVCRPITNDPEIKKPLVRLWDEWIPDADADGVLDFYGLQTLATRNWLASGEILVRLRPRRANDGLAVPLQVQLLESDMLPQLDTTVAPGLPNGNVIRSGIEFNRMGKRVAYWLHSQHPGEKQSAVNVSRLTRVPAEFILHIYEPIRPGQLRGVSEYSPILAKLRGVMDFDDAVLERQKLANLFTMFLTRELPEHDEHPLSGKAEAADSAGDPIVGLEPGLSQELQPGEDVKFSSPPDAGANYGEFMRQQNLGVSAGQGLPYELLTGDVRDISDRTLRVIINEFRRHCEQRQWQIIIPQFCQPIRNAWSSAAALSGALTTQLVEEAKRVRWQPQGWAYIHPVQDAQGKVIEVKNGFRSRTGVVTERGDDIDLVDEERTEDAERERNLIKAGAVTNT